MKSIALLYSVQYGYIASLPLPAMATIMFVSFPHAIVTKTLSRTYQIEMVILYAAYVVRKGGRSGRPARPVTEWHHCIPSLSCLQALLQFPFLPHKMVIPNKPVCFAHRFSDLSSPVIGARVPFMILNQKAIHLLQ